MKKLWMTAAMAAALVVFGGAAQAAEGDMAMDPTKLTAGPSKIVQTAGRDGLGEFAPKFAELNDDVLFGEVWSRTDKLCLRDRSLVTVIALMSSGILDSSLKYHIGEAKKNGVTAVEMSEAITHAAFYVGWPKAWAVFRMAREVYEEA